MWVGEDGGRLTERRPDVPEEEMFHIHEDDLPSLERSHAWRQASKMAGIVKEQHPKDFSAERVSTVMTSIRSAAECPLQGGDPRVEEAIQRGIGTMKTVAGTAEKSLPAFTAPSRAAVRACLRFGLTITQASNVLAVLLRQYAEIPSPLDNTSLVERILASADHLIDRASALSRERMEMNLTSFYDATYLGLLYGNAALLLLRETSKHLPDTSEERRLFDGRSLYIDEFMAHEFAPCLMHPIDLTPCSLEESFHASNYGIADAGGIYPGAGNQGPGRVDYQARWPQIQAHSAKSKQVDLIATVEAENDPLHSDEAQRLMMFLITLDLGSQIGGDG